MLPVVRKTRAAVPPRWNLGGLVPAWEPDCPAPSALPVADFTLDAAHSTPCGDFRPALPMHEEIEGWSLREPTGYPIGWFDLAALERALRAQNEGEGEETVGRDRKPLSEADHFIRRLAAALQPPIAALCAPHGVLDWPAPLLGYQREGIATLLSRRALLLADDMGLGKAQPLYSKILTPYGWKQMGEVHVGDEVINSQGSISYVTGVFPQGEKDIYRVEFTDGSATECCDDHLWQVLSPVRKYRGVAPQVVPLREIRAKLTHASGNLRHFVPLVKPVEFEQPPLRIDPYLLGALIGDGCFARHSPMFSTADEDMVREISGLLPEGISIVNRGYGKGYDWHLIGKRAGLVNPLIAALKAYGLWGHLSTHKFIPLAYKFSSSTTRLALLQGLLDTDGHVRPTDNNIEFCTASLQLAEDVVFLVQSLGGTARLRVKSTSHKYRGELRYGTAYRMSIALPYGIQPFRLPRKADLYHDRPKYQPTRGIKSVTPIGRKQAQCIAVDAPDNLYVTDDFILTHNTVQSIAALRILAFQQQINTTLLVCPASLLSQWKRELARWARELKVVTVAGGPAERGGLWRVPAHVKLVSYETLRADVLDLQDSPVLRTPWDVVVLDEASRIKNRETGITLACKRLPRDRRWALTGTPLENSLEDVVSLLEFLTGEPGERSGPALTSSQIRRQLRDLQLRRRKDEVLTDLPPKQINELSLELPPAQRAAYDQAEQEGRVRLTEAGTAVTITHVLELISRLKQLCNSDPVSGESAKLADIRQRLGTLTEEGHRALVFSQFTDDTFGLGRAAAYLKEFQPLQYTGSLSSHQKSALIERFVSDPRHKALLVSLRAGGVGLNLQAASYVFHLDRWWNPALEDQAESRAHRMGQRYPVTVFRYICANTIEERIDKKLKEKRRMFADIVDDVSLDIATALNEKELFGLFGLTPPRAAGPRAASAHTTRFETMSGAEFEAWIGERLGRLGFQVEQTPASRDGGIDLIASRRDALQIETRLFVQCKNHREPVGIAVIRELRGVVPDRAAGATPVVACPGGFTAEAVAFASENGVHLWGPDELKQLESQAT